MKLKTMLYGLTLMLGCFVLASCVNDEEGPCLPDGKTQIVFSLVMQDNAQTRAWGVPQANDREIGEGKENDIDLSTLKLLIFDNDDESYVGTLSNTEIEYVARKTGTLPYEETVYECIGTINPDKITLNKGVYKFVFLANYTGPIPTDQQGKITWESLKTAVFTPSLANFNSNAELIPMWGVMTTPALTLVPGNRQDLGDVALLRAMSKVTVALTGTATKMDGFGYISKVEVTNYNKTGNVVPKLKDYSSVTSTIALDEEECVNENTADAATGLVIYGSTDTKKLTFYLLDYENTKEGKTAAELIVTLGKTDAKGNPVMDGEGDSAKPVVKTFDFAPIKFCVYEDGAPTATAYDIVRNHYYLFNIYKVTEPSLWVEPTILPWTVQSEHDYTTGITVRLGTLNDNDKFLRYDSDKDFNSWAGSYIAAAYSELTTTNPAPLYSPPLSLVSTSKTPLYLHIDNPLFRFVKRNPDTETNQALDPETDIRIEPGSHTTIFYVVPIEDYNDAEHNARECHLSLISGDSTSGLAERVPLRSSLPGFAVGTDEVWFYWIGSTVWQNYKTEEAWKDYLRMYPDDF